MMGLRRLQFATKPDKNGNIYRLTVDVDNKQFARNNHYINSEFIKIGRRDYDKLVGQLRWFGFKEIN